VFSICETIKLDFVSEHCQKTCLLKNHKKSIDFERKTVKLNDKKMNSTIKMMKLMINDIFLHKVDEFAYILMNIDRNLMIL